MKKLFSISSMLLCLFGAKSQAQVPFTTMDSVNINNISAPVLVHGDMWWDPVRMEPDCVFPAGTGKTISSTGALWMSGYDAGSNLHIAAQTYRQTGNDYWPGPLDGSDTLTHATSQSWAKIWKVNRTDIDAFRTASAAGTATPTNTAAVIWEWPAKGNTGTKGNSGVTLAITDDMAPFVDLNGNGIYEPTLGEYPDVKGDQALWYIFSDNGPTHTETHGRALGVEVHAMAYAYKRENSYDNMVFYQYTVKNKSANNYQNFRIGQFADMDLGQVDNDFIGFDSTRDMGFVYNGTATDAVYGANIPMAGVLMMPISGLTSAGSFMYYSNDPGIAGNPINATEYDNYLRSKFKDGTHASNDFSGPAIPSLGYGSGPLTNYVFTGNPGNTAQWSECTSGNTPGDRRFLITTGDMNLNAGASVVVTTILIVTQPGPANACGDAGLSITGIQSLADSARGVYDQGGLPSLSASNTVLPIDNAITIFPNPAHDKLLIENAGSNTGETHITVYNAIGQAMNITTNTNGQKSEADISKLPAGLYNVLYQQGSAQQSASFIKE